MRKKIYSLCMFLFLIIISNIVLAASSFNLELKTNTNEIKAGDTVKVTVHMKDVNIEKEGISILVNKLFYDDEVFEQESLKITPLNNWSTPMYNPENKMMIIDNANGAKEDGDVFEISLKAKDKIKAKETKIGVIEVQGSDSMSDIETPDVYVNLKIHKGFSFLTITMLVGIFIIVSLTTAYIVYKNERNKLL